MTAARPTISVWLDDVRPKPASYTHHCKTAQEARDVLSQGTVDAMSLDHDLGICARCTPGTVSEAANIVVVSSLDSVCKKECACACHETGYDLVKWMAANDVWSRQKPKVHSANPVGAENMRAMIDRYWKPPCA